MNHEESRTLYDRALSVMPGGVNSAVRAAFEPYSPFVQWGDGGHVIDVRSGATTSSEATLSANAPAEERSLARSRSFR